MAGWFHRDHADFVNLGFCALIDQTPGRAFALPGRDAKGLRVVPQGWPGGPLDAAGGILCRRLSHRNDARGLPRVHEENRRRHEAFLSVGIEAGGATGPASAHRFGRGQPLNEPRPLQALGTFSQRPFFADLSTASQTYWVSRASRKVGLTGLRLAAPSRKSANW